MKALLLIIAVVLVTVFVGETANASQEQCYGIAASTDQQAFSNITWFAQQYTPAMSTQIVSITLNVYTSIGDTGNFYVTLHNTAAGLPTTQVASAVVQKAASTGIEGLPGIGQSFSCSLIKTEQTFTFATPISVTGGTMYAITLHHTTNFQSVKFGIIRNAEGTAPLQGLTCSDGAPCDVGTGWSVWSFAGDNADIPYSIDDIFVDPNASGAFNDGTINSWISILRDFMRLGGTDGGLIFSMLLILFIFVIGLRSRIPFPIAGSLNLLLAGALTQENIMPGWILITVIAVAGMGLIFTVLNSRGDQEIEG